MCLFFLNVAFVGLLTTTTAGLTPVSTYLITLLVITQFSDQVKIKLIAQLINCISSVIQKLLEYFNGTIILTFSFSVLIPSNFPVILAL